MQSQVINELNPIQTNTINICYDSIDAMLKCYKYITEEIKKSNKTEKQYFLDNVTSTKQAETNCRKFRYIKKASEHIIHAQSSRDELIYKFHDCKGNVRTFNRYIS